MKRRILLLFVRPALFCSLLSSVALSFGAELPLIPSAPANHIYDPDFLLSKKASADLSHELAAFEEKSDVTIYLALYTATPRLIEETAEDLNQAWNQAGYGAVVVFAPRRPESRVLPSPELSLLEDADKLSVTFGKAAQAGLARGDYSAAAASGVEALMKRLADVDARVAPPSKTAWHPTRGQLLMLFAGLALAGVAFLAFAARIWRSANLFDHSYQFPVPTAPAPLRFGGRRCGGHMATIDFRDPS